MNNLEKLNKIKRSVQLEYLEIYTCEIEEDELIDYIVIAFEFDLKFIIEIDSSGENISFISVNDLETNIKKSGIQYKINRIIEKPLSFNYFSAEYNEWQELNTLNFIFGEIKLKITLDVDSFKVAMFQT